MAVYVALDKTGNSMVYMTVAGDEEEARHNVEEYIEQTLDIRPRADVKGTLEQFKQITEDAENQTTSRVLTV